MSTALLTATETTISQQQALDLAQATLLSMHLRYDEAAGLQARLARKHASAPLVWTVSYQTEPNPFGFEQETNYIEVDGLTGEVLAILTPRGDLLKRLPQLPTAL
ncbi:hypothetical protein [Hymenobacter crusticola]|uniref:PepSY domain-containing protein n=1 Tax=Hymenobacter crusticola TaxID=1770526 RepID=A0A243W505_9BACT|nr:hypothetical protein [Hymenobacter crusticola]OUJ67775.1 hypothetical protein BXP70_28505 [Hymenobacter crusticola]